MTISGGKEKRANLQKNNRKQDHVQDQRDKSHWQWSKEGTYSIASCYKVITHRGNIDKITKRIWKI